jgi:hypothetical protein
MGQPKPRCPQCGAKNQPVARCRICHALLPVYEVAPEPAAAARASFQERVQMEIAQWHGGSELNHSAASRSRRPSELDSAGSWPTEAELAAETRGRRFSWRRRAS